MYPPGQCKNPTPNRQRFQSGGLIFSRHSFSRHSGESRNLPTTMDSAFRRSDGSKPFRLFRYSGFPVIPILPVIPAFAGIYALRWTMAFLSFRFFPSFRRKPESTHHDELRFSPERRIHTIPIFPSYRLFRHSGASRNLRATMDAERPGLTCLQPSFRRKPESTRYDRLRFSPKRRIPAIPAFPSFRFFSSFRRKPESTRCAGLRFSPERRIHTIPIFPSYRVFRHSGESRNLRVAIDSAFPRNDGSKPFRLFHHSGFPRHSGESRNLRPTMDSGFRRSDGSAPTAHNRPPFQSDRLTPRRPNAVRNPVAPPALPLTPARPPPGQPPTRKETPQ